MVFHIYRALPDLYITRRYIAIATHVLFGRNKDGAPGFMETDIPALEIDTAVAEETCCDKCENGESP